MKNHKIKFLALMCTFTLVFGLRADRLGESIRAEQHCPWDGKVDIEVSSTTDVPALVKNAEYTFFATNKLTNAAIPISHIEDSGEVIGSGTKWVRKFVWNAAADLGDVKICEVALTASVVAWGGVQLWEKGPYWAEHNVGAKSPEEYGYYFWWGGTTAYKRNASDNGWVSVEDGSSYIFDWENCPVHGLNNEKLVEAGYLDSTDGRLTYIHDAAFVHCGSPWLMPTTDEFNDLIDNCTTVWTNRNGVWGQLVIGKGNYSSKSIFLPAAGYGDSIHDRDLDSSDGEEVAEGDYWSSSAPQSTALAPALYVNKGNGRYGMRIRLEDLKRHYGLPVRPVRAASTGECIPNVVTTEFNLAADNYATITALTAVEQNPYNGKVDISVEFFGSSNAVAQMEYDFVATNKDTMTPISISDMKKSGSITGAVHRWTQKFVWDALADIGGAAVDTIALSVETEQFLGGVQLWEGGPYWAECNVGATQANENGYYFWIGDTIGYTRNANKDGWVSSDNGESFVFATTNCPTWNIANLFISGSYLDGWGNLIASRDAARVHLGTPWRMPTDAEFANLVSNCTATWTTRNGVCGRLVSGKGDFESKSIFLPAAGYGDDSGLCKAEESGNYWSASLGNYYPQFAGLLLFDSSDFKQDMTYRYYGLPVRPIRDSSENPHCVATTELAFYGETKNTEVAVPYSWLEKYYPGVTDYESAAGAKSGKRDAFGHEISVWEEYVAGTDPTNETSVFEAKIEMVDGKPKVTWEPDLNEDGVKSLRSYKIWGKEALGDLDWIYPTNDLHRFFRVTVEMP